MKNLNIKAIGKLLLEALVALLAMMIGGIGIASFALSLYFKNAKYTVWGGLIAIVCGAAATWATNKLGETLKKERLYHYREGDGM